MLRVRWTWPSGNYSTKSFWNWIHVNNDDDDECGYHGDDSEGYDHEETLQR